MSNSTFSENWAYSDGGGGIYNGEDGNSTWEHYF